MVTLQIVCMLAMVSLMILIALDSCRLKLASFIFGAYDSVMHGKICDIYPVFYPWTTKWQGASVEVHAGWVQRTKTVAWRSIDTCQIGKWLLLLKYFFWYALVKMWPFVLHSKMLQADMHGNNCSQILGVHQHVKLTHWHLTACEAHDVLISHDVPVSHGDA